MPIFCTLHWVSVGSSKNLEESARYDCYSKTVTETRARTVLVKGTRLYNTFVSLSVAVVGSSDMHSELTGTIATGCFILGNCLLHGLCENNATGIYYTLEVYLTCRKHQTRLRSVQFLFCNKILIIIYTAKYFVVASTCSTNLLQYLKSDEVLYVGLYNLFFLYD